MASPICRGTPTLKQIMNLNHISLPIVIDHCTENILEYKMGRFRPKLVAADMATPIGGPRIHAACFSKNVGS